MPKDPQPADAAGERDETAERAHASEIIAEYHNTDPDIPLGGLPVASYEHWRRECNDELLSPEDTFKRGWLELEFAMAALRGGINDATEEAYEQKETNVAFDRANRYFAIVAKDESAPAVLRWQARIAAASIPQHKEVVLGKPMLTTPRPYFGYLNTLRATADDMLANPVDSPEYQKLLHAITVEALITEGAFPAGWFLPAAARQPWDITMHNSERQKPDVPTVIGLTDQPNEKWLYIDEQAMIAPAMAHFSSDDPFILIQTYNKVEVGYASMQRGTIRRQVPGQKRALAAHEFMYTALDNSSASIQQQLSDHVGRLMEQGVWPADQMIEKTSAPEVIERDPHPEVVWYITEYAGGDIDMLQAQIKSLEQKRQQSRFLSQEQAALGWMQLEFANQLAHIAEGDTEMLAESRQQYSDAMDSFTRAAKVFGREHMPGNMLDMLLAIESAQAYRGIFSSTDPYAVRRAVRGYAEKVAELCAQLESQASKLSVSNEQFVVLMAVMRKAAVCLLQSAATDETARHLALSAPLRNGFDSVIAYPIDCTPKVPAYDRTSPVMIELGEGDELKAKPSRVLLGQGKIDQLGDITTVLSEMAGVVLAGTAKPTASKKGAKGKGGKAVPVLPKQRRPELDDLSIELGDKINDASEGVDDDQE